MVKKPRIEIFNEAKSKGSSELGFRVRSKNGRTVTASTGYNTFQGAQKSISALAEIMKSDPQVVDLRETLKRGKKAEAVKVKPKTKTKAKPKTKVKPKSATKKVKKAKPQKKKTAAPKQVTRNGRATSKIIHATRRMVTASRNHKVTHGRKTASKSALGVAA